MTDRIDFQNLRFGFATNSSSSHSIIFDPYYKMYSPYETPEEITEVSDNEFGWENFRLDTDIEKLTYIAQTIIDNRRWDDPNCDEKILQSLVRDVLAYDIELGGYVDHQSVLTLPLDRKTNLPDSEFIRHLAGFIRRPDVHILGGNDNDEYEFPKYGECYQEFSPIPTDSSHPRWCRFDPKTNSWTLFSTEDGTKIRFSFDNPNNEINVKSTFPELIDLKLTDYCPYGCEFCYMGSTLKGKHGKLENIEKILATLSEAGVFEIAFGGGEPTLHPNFREIIEKTKNQYRMVPNFTTKNIRIIKEYEWLSQIVGGVAFSVTKVEEVDQIVEQIKSVNLECDDFCVSRYRKPKYFSIILHVVIGTVTKAEFVKILTKASEAHFGITLLGYKTTGRGDEFTPKYFNWLQACKNLREQDRLPQLGIDTVLAKKYEKKIIESGIPSWAFYTKEGAFSAYIDAVDMKIAPSSFCSESEKISIGKDFDLDKLEKLYSKF